MIYFFSRGAEFMQCEVYPGSPHVLTLIAPGTAEHEEYELSDKLHERLDELTRDLLTRDGWQGPLGRDARKLRCDSASVVVKRSPVLRSPVRAKRYTRGWRLPLLR